MESTPPTSKRVKTRAVRSGGRLEGWFSGDNDLIEKYKFETSTKVMNNPKVVCFDWLKSQKLDNVRISGVYLLFLQRRTWCISTAL